MAQIFDTWNVRTPFRIRGGWRRDSEYFSFRPYHIRSIEAPLRLCKTDSHHTFPGFRLANLILLSIILVCLKWLWKSYFFVTFLCLWIFNTCLIYQVFYFLITYMFNYIKIQHLDMYILNIDLLQILNERNSF